MTDLNAAIVLEQLRRWPELKKKRALIWDHYQEYFGEKDPGHSQHIYALRVKNRQSFREKLYGEGIGTGIHYNSFTREPIHEIPRYAPVDQRHFPNAERFGRETVSLPLSTTMTLEDAERVVNAVKETGEIL